MRDTQRQGVTKQHHTVMINSFIYPWNGPRGNTHGFEVFFRSCNDNPTAVRPSADSATTRDNTQIKPSKPSPYYNDSTPRNITPFTVEHVYKTAVKTVNRKPSPLAVAATTSVMTFISIRLLRSIAQASTPLESNFVEQVPMRTTWKTVHMDTYLSRSSLLRPPACGTPVVGCVSPGGRTAVGDGVGAPVFYMGPQRRRSTQQSTPSYFFAWTSSLLIYLPVHQPLDCDCALCPEPCSAPPAPTSVRVGLSCDSSFV